MVLIGHNELIARMKKKITWVINRIHQSAAFFTNIYTDRYTYVFPFSGFNVDIPASLLRAVLLDFITSMAQIKTGNAVLN